MGLIILSQRLAIASFFQNDVHIFFKYSAKIALNMSSWCKKNASPLFRVAPVRPLAETQASISLLLRNTNLGERGGYHFPFALPNKLRRTMVEQKVKFTTLSLL